MVEKYINIKDFRGFWRREFRENRGYREKEERGWRIEKYRDEGG